MNFKLKALVAAVALAAVAGQASAAVALPTATVASDAIFFAIDQASGNSFAFDLGNISGLATLNQNITGGAFSAYLTAEGGSLASTTWGIAYNLGNNAATSLWGSTVTAGSVIGGETSAKMFAGRSAFNNFLTLTALTTAGSSAYTNAANAGNFTNGMKNSWGGNAAGWTTDNAVGTAADFYTVTAATSAAGGTLVVSGITFDGVKVAVAAVPEPETYSMLAAGLLMLGAVARRRKA
jgi:hypothetical protein